MTEPLKQQTLTEFAQVLIEAEKTGRPVECHCVEDAPVKGWIAWSGTFIDLDALVYRVQPPKPREFWVNEYDDEKHRYGSLHTSPKAASAAVRLPNRRFIRTLRLVEDLGEDA